MSQIKKVPTQRAREHDQKQAHTRQLMLIDHGKVQAHHAEKHRQRKVIVEKRTLLGFVSTTLIRRSALLHRRYERLLSGNDAKKNVSHHDAAQDRTHMDKSSPGREQSETQKTES